MAVESRVTQEEIKKEPEKPIDREKTCPLLLRVFTTNNGRHHRMDEFSRGNVPSSELQIYTCARCSRAVSPSRVTARDRSFLQKPRIRSMDQPHARPQRPRTFESRRRKRHWFRDSRKALLARAEASREETGGASRKRACGFRLPASCAGVRRAAVRRGWRHVPDRAPAPRPHPRPAVDREAPAAATRVGAGEAEHGPPPGSRGGEPLLAQPAFPHGRAGAGPRGGPPGGRLPGAQGGSGVQVPRVPAAGGPARPPQGHREVVLTRATPPASCGDEREPLAGAPRSPGQAERVPATEAPGPRSPPPAVCFGRIASRFSCPEDGTDDACVLRDAERNLRAAAIKLPTALWPLGLGARFCRGLCRACSLTFCRQVLPKRT